MILNKDAEKSMLTKITLKNILGDINEMAKNKLILIDLKVSSNEEIVALSLA